MKLSPPASSSDIELAREIARRLHQRRRREDRPGTSSHAPQPRPAPPDTRPRSAAAAPPPAPPAWQPPVAPPRAAMPARARIEHPPAPRPPVDEPAPPSWDSLPALDVPRDLPDEVPQNTEPEDALDALTAGVTQEPVAARSDEPAPPPIELEDEAGTTGAGSEGPATFDEADAYGGAPEASPFDEADSLEAPGLEPADLEAGDLDATVDTSGLQAGRLETTDLDAADVAQARPDSAPAPEFDVPEFASAAPDAASEEEELFEDSPGPSWGDVVDSCMTLAHAHGALLADASGTLIAARGEWPEPGAEAIASRLVAMMDRTLRDAPTRSVSAPVGGLHLTAWRVPVGDRLLTAAFIAEAPVRADTRPSIDAEVQRGAAA